MSIPGDWINWGIVIAAGLVTLAVRAAFIVLPAGVRVPDWLTRSLKYVAAAVLPALVIPDVLYRDAPAGETFNLVRILAALVAVGVAWKTRSIFATLVAGMAALWLIKWWGAF